MHVIRKLALLAIPTLLGACAEGDGPRSTEVDRLALFRADSLFAYETAERGADGWAAHFLVDGVMYPTSGRIDGPEQIREFMAPADDIARAAQDGLPLRLHTASGEVLVARILDWDGAELRYTVVRSSKPERYAVCDSTGFSLTLDEIERVQVLSEDSAESSGRRRSRG